MSQDPLELFFGCIRASLGFNNNPTVQQFMGAYKKLCAGALLKTGRGSNCLWDGQLKCLDSLEKDVPDVSENYTDVLANYLKVDDYQDNVLKYMSGAAQRKIANRLDCKDCVRFLTSNDSTLISSLIAKKNRGGLLQANEHVFGLVKVLNATVSNEAKSCDIFQTKNIYQKLLVKSIDTVATQKPWLFNDICEDPAHKTYVMRELAKYFLSAKLGHMTRKFKKSMAKHSRHNAKKIPIFHHE